VSGSLFPSGGIQGDCNISKEVGGVEEIFQNVVSFSNVKNLFFKFLKILN